MDNDPPNNTAAPARSLADAGLVRGDCLRVMPTLPDAFVDATITSPPYDGLRTYNGFEYDYAATARELLRITKQGGVAVVILADETVDGGESGTSFRTALSYIDAGWRLHDTMIWRKPNFSNPSRGRYHQVFEYMFVFSKGRPKTFNPLMDRVNKYSGKVGSVGKNTVRQRDGSFGERRRKIVSPFGMRHNVWDCKTSGQESFGRVANHPATFPESLVRDHILSWTNPGDLVFDPFAGSGTTLAVAKMTGRRYLGCEIDAEYYASAVKRIESANAREPSDDAPAKNQTSTPPQA